jgi:hypothetical protein
LLSFSGESLARLSIKSISKALVYGHLLRCSVPVDELAVALSSTWCWVSFVKIKLEEERWVQLLGQIHGPGYVHT